MLRPAVGLRRDDARGYGRVASAGSIVRQIVRAVEAYKPRARYVAPWWQGFGVRLLRAFGK